MVFHSLQEHALYKLLFVIHRIAQTRNQKLLHDMELKASSITLQTNMFIIIKRKIIENNSPRPSAF